MPERQHDVLAALALFEQWARPLDVGSRDGSNHRSSLQALVEKGFAEQRVRAPFLEKFRGAPLYKRLYTRYITRHAANRRGQERDAREYRITPAGREIVGERGTR